MCADLEKWSMDERSEGRAEGRTEDAELLARLLKLLQAEGRTDDVKLALEDKEARERLYKAGKGCIRNIIWNKSEPNKA